jgi:hypothetical protein
MFCRVVWWSEINVSETRAASIFRVETLVSNHHTTQRNNPEAMNSLSIAVRNWNKKLEKMIHLGALSQFNDAEITSEVTDV